MRVPFDVASAVAGHVRLISSGMLALGGATLADAPASALFLSFAFYGFIGWAYESTLCALLNHGFFSNSGFLLGPCCPIYGVGALACWLGLRGIESVPAQFVSAALVCCAIEYVAGWWLERTTRARFWDYSDFPLNIKGRVCLYGVLVFGTGAVLVCHVIQPSVLHALSLAPGWLVVAAAVLIGLVMAIDAVFALASWKRLSSQLETVRSELADRINESLKETSDSMARLARWASDAKRRHGLQMESEHLTGREHA
ncbi:protein of unknown function DUF1113 [Coriobacterium glomerans PW2]|uniref:ABC transporter permease n=1 Tax=Coriobacterium glomerans (strain ATCC 49209 / DSM 20642 / JCM 10262 / PW2) TaxID=700015 RepID=F2N737_CORGP|nr:putative ABC transporter permease [Coriobacterium glomerans]AEB06376.1 protein of unknown function DUF1113 [Coriobacterium glomerans PW2]